MKGMASKATGDSSIKFNDFLYRSYIGNGLKSVRWLNHQIWSFLKEILWRGWPQKRQVAQASNLVISYMDLIKEMASKARWLKHQIWWFLKEILWRGWPQRREVAQASNFVISYMDLIEEMASKAWGGSSIKFDDFLKRSYGENGLKSDRWLKHWIL